MKRDFNLTCIIKKLQFLFILSTKLVQ